MKSIPVIFDSRFCSAIDLQPGTSSKASEMPAALKRPRFPQPWSRGKKIIGLSDLINRYQHSTALSRVPRLLFQVVRGPLDVDRCSKPTSQPEPKGSIEPRSKPCVIPYWFVKNGILSWMMILLNIRVYVLYPFNIMLCDFIWIVEPPKNHQPGHGAQQKGFAVPSDQRWQHLGSEVEVQTWPIALMENTLGGAYTSAKII